MRQLTLFKESLSESVLLEFSAYNVFLNKLDCTDELQEFFCDYFHLYPETVNELIESTTIIIKVNLTSDEDPKNGRTSSPFVLEALINSFNIVGINLSKILVADSSVIGVDTIIAAAKGGILDICNKFNIPFQDLNSGKFVRKKVEKPLKNTSIPIHELFESEGLFSVNLGKIKTTYGSPVGFCVKNLKGIIPPDTKLEFHLNGVQESLCDLRHVYTSNLNILEGFPASQLGSPKECNLIGISNNDVLLDCIVSELIGIPFSSVPHLDNLISENEYYIQFLEKNLEKISYVKHVIPKFRFSLHGVKDMAEEFGIDIIDGRLCSSCLESFYKALIKLDKNNTLPSDPKYVVGMWHIETDWDLYKNIKFVWIGECALQTPVVSNIIYDAAKKSKSKDLKITSDNLFIPGCPPTIDSMVSKIKKYYKLISDNAEQEPSSLLENHEKSLSTLVAPSKLIKSWVSYSPIEAAASHSVVDKIIEIMPKEEVVFNDLEIRVAIQCELICSAICHKINWDYLRRKIREKALSDPGYWAFSNIRYLKKIDIEHLFCDYTKKGRIRGQERVNILRQLPSISDNGILYFYDILKSLGDEAHNPETILSLLRRIDAFSEDPEEKKAQVFLHSLIKSNLWDFKDSSNSVRPAIDYHIMRLYIRRGLVYYLNALGKNYLTNNVKRKPSTTSSLRTIVANAMHSVAVYSKYSIIEINGVDWWIGRSVCTREDPDCNLVGEKSHWLKKTFNKCPYKRTCYAQIYDNSFLKIQEPRENSSFY